GCASASTTSSCGRGGPRSSTPGCRTGSAPPTAGRWRCSSCSAGRGSGPTCGPARARPGGAGSGGRCRDSAAGPGPEESGRSRRPRGRGGPMDQPEVDAELEIAAELLDATQFGHLAYTGADGTPRVVPIGIYWTGTEFVVSTA